MTAEEVFRELSGHMLTGIMMHAQLADYYDFLSLCGYARCHEYHMYDERIAMKRLHRYYIGRYDRLVEEASPTNPDVIPSTWYRYTRQDVGTGDKRSAVRSGMERWVSWETDTKRFYEEMYKELTEASEIAAAEMVAGLIEDVDEELAHAKREHLDLMAADYDIGYILGQQEMKKQHAETLMQTLRG